VPWRFLDAGQLSLRSLLVAGVQKPAQVPTCSDANFSRNVKQFTVHSASLCENLRYPSDNPVDVLR
jgi:hypothetical protein